MTLGSVQTGVPSHKGDGFLPQHFGLLDTVLSLPLALLSFPGRHALPFLLVSITSQPKASALWCFCINLTFYNPALEPRDKHFLDISLVQ